MKTRNKKSSAPVNRKPEITANEQTSARSLEPREPDPPHIAVLPENASTQSRIVTVPICDSKGQVTDVPYFVDPTRGFYEFTRISPHIGSLGSWLLVPNPAGSSQTTQDERELRSEAEVDRQEEDEADQKDGYILSSPDLLIATPVDPLMILLAVDGVVFPLKDDHGRTVFSTLDDTIWELKEKSTHIRSILDTNPGCRLEELLRSRIRSISEKGTAGLGDTGYRAQLPLVAHALLKVARRMVLSGLPKTMESHFVKPALEVPEQVLKRTLNNDDDESSSSPRKDEGGDLATEAELPTIVTPSDDAIVNLLRLRTALHFLLSKYIRADLSRQLQTFWNDPSAAGIDFTPLDTELARIAALKLEAQALRSISDNISRKRSAIDDDEAMEREDAKRRKREEDELKKKNVSLGVKKLMKADTSGMKKLSSFFTKAPGKTGKTA